MRLLTLKDLDSSEGTVQLHSTTDSGRLILHPTPNPNDPNDPLRWPRWKKHICFISVCSFVFLTSYGNAGLSPAFYILSLEFDKTETQISGLLLWQVLTLGLFNFFWVPMANYFGKRPVFVFALLLLSLCYLWGAVAQTFDSLLWSQIIAGFAGSSTEALGAAIVNDLYFLHERGTLMSIYMNAISGGNTIGPLICACIVTGLSWRWHKWISFILTLANWFVVVLFCPETRYDRSEAASATTPDGGFVSKSAASTPDEISKSDSKTASAQPDELFDSTGQQVPKKSWTQELSLWSGVPKSTNIALMFIRPLPLIALPAVIFSFLAYSISLAWVLTINVTNPFVLQAPPYSWRPVINGLINIPGLIGNVAGAWLGGWCVDRYSDWCSKRNNGVFEPETRLHLLIVPALLVPAGCLAYGYGVQEDLHWTAIFFGYGMVATGLTAVPVATFTYISDCYLPVNADALLLVNGLKNIFAFGFLYGIVPWVTDTGYINSFGTQAGIYVGVMLFLIPLIVCGKQIRHATARWRIVLS